MNLIFLLPHWLRRAFSPPQGRHCRRNGLSAPVTEHRSVRPAPDACAIRMDDPTDPRRYSLPRQPFLVWEARRCREPSASLASYTPGV